MGITDLFSKRQRRARGEMPDVFQYDDLPRPFRVQLLYIVQELFQSRQRDSNDAFEHIFHTLSREYGEAITEHRAPANAYGHVRWFESLQPFVFTTTTERVLDFIEVAFATARTLQNDVVFGYPRLPIHACTTELNTRFKEHGIGYQYENGEIIRVDSQYLHAEAVKPVLSVLSPRRFAGANAEFLKAHEHYRHGRHGEAMNECLKSLESCLKVICRDRRWQYNETDQAKTLLNIVFTNELLPSWLQSEFNGLRSTLESGVPTARNKMSGHGAGAEPREVPDYFAAYLLHLTAAAILFLSKADDAPR